MHYKKLVMKANKFKVKANWIFKAQILKAELQISIKKGTVKLDTDFLYKKFNKKCAIIALITAVWKIFRFVVKILSLYSFLNHS